MSTHYGVDLKEPLLTQVNVVDDFFPPEVFYQVHKWFTHECYWFYNPYVNKEGCLLYTSPSPRDGRISRMPSSA